MRSTTERRQLIIETLCLRRNDTIDRLAEEFGVSRRTIRYDLEVLQCSYPIETVKGAGGGVRVMDGYYIGMKYMTDSQTALLNKLSENLSGDELETMQSILKTFLNPKAKVG